MTDHILIVDDQADIRLQLKGLLSDEGYAIHEAYHAESAFAVLAGKKVDLVLLDIWLEGSTMDGVEILEVIHKKYPNLPVIMISGHGNIELAVQAIKKGAYDFIEKPFKTDHLLHLCHRAIEAYKLKTENTQLRERSIGPLKLTGKSPALQQVYQLIERFAPTNSRVLINGEAGTGKSIVARMLHAKSTYSGGPFEVLNCALAAPDTIEEVLFGLEDGQGKIIKPGLFEQANGGTLFLDEVADLSSSVQGKLVKMLQSSTYNRVNGNTPIKADMRLISSTQKNLPDEIKQGHFREDLYYRLAVVPLNLPPLSDRREDLPTLINELVQEISQTTGRPACKLSDDTMAFMQSYSWPGNIRQLKNTIEWLTIMYGADHTITPDDLPPELKTRKLLASNSNGGAETASPATRIQSIMTLPLKQARENFEKEYLEVQVERFGGNISKTAHFIGMERSALHRKLKSLGITSSTSANGNDDGAEDSAIISPSSR